MRLSILILAFFTALSSCQSNADSKTLVSTEISITLENGLITPLPSATSLPTLEPIIPPTMPPSKPPIKPFASKETAVTEIPLSGPASERNAEISGMAWFGNWLILLPQYPNFGSTSGDGCIFALPREDIIHYLNGELTDPLTPIEIPFIAPDLSKKISGFEGYEAILFNENNAFLTMEASPTSGMTGYLVKGTMANDLSGLAIETGQFQEITSATGLPNKSDEALLLYNDKILTIHEANGQTVNPQPVATIFTLDLEPDGNIPMAQIEYRITDATEVDELGRFWAINYFFPGEPELNSNSDQIAESYGQGLTHITNTGVERLVEFQIQEDSITIVDNSPIQLELLPNDLRNWEGIVRLEGHGFLLVTDKFPQTILGFVPN